MCRSRRASWNSSELDRPALIRNLPEGTACPGHGSAVVAHICVQPVDLRRLEVTEEDVGRAVYRRALNQQYFRGLWKGCGQLETSVGLGNYGCASHFAAPPRSAQNGDDGRSTAEA